MMNPAETHGDDPEDGQMAAKNFEAPPGLDSEGILEPIATAEHLGQDSPAKELRPVATAEHVEARATAERLEVNEREASGAAEAADECLQPVARFDRAAEAVPVNQTSTEPAKPVQPAVSAERMGLNYHPLQLVTSTLLSLAMVFLLLLAARWLVPSLVESVRYSWYRGQLRAEYEVSGQQLRSVSLDSLAEVSQLVSRRVSPSLVHINLLRDQKTLSQYEAVFGSQHPNVRFEGQGSGFVIDTQGHILTNEHVVRGDGGIEVTLSDGRRLSAQIVGVDSQTDLAVLKVKADDLLAIDWGDSDAIVVGTPVWAAGSLFGLQQTVTFGIISGKHRVDFRATRYDHKIPGDAAYGDMMQSDVALNPGNSGGPLLNSMGEVVGVNAAILGETFHGVSFSIPSCVARRVAEELIARGEVTRGWLGVAMKDLDDAERFDSEGRMLPGVRVTGFPANQPSPARKAGVRIDDIIVEYQRQPVMNQVELRRMIGETPIGTPATIAVLRGEQRLEFTAAIGKRDVDLP